MPEYMSSLAGVLSGGGVVALMAWFFTRKWLERVESAPEKLAARIDEMLKRFEARLDRMEQETRACSMDFLDKFRTKEESKQAWTEHKAHEEKQWSQLDELKQRVASLETACKLNHKD